MNFKFNIKQNSVYIFEQRYFTAKQLHVCILHLLYYFFKFKTRLIVNINKLKLILKHKILLKSNNVRSTNSIGKSSYFIMVNHILKPRLSILKFLILNKRIR